MSDYGCCVLNVCVHNGDYKTCDDCPFYDKNFFKEVHKKLEEKILEGEECKH